MEALLGFPLDAWDYATFLALVIISAGFVVLLYLFLGLPGRIAIARRHPEAEAVSIMGWLGFLGVVPWVQALIWSLKPSNVVDIRDMPRERRQETEEQNAKLTGKPLTQAPRRLRRRAGRDRNMPDDRGTVITTIYCSAVWLVFFRFKLIRFGPGWGIISGLFGAHIILRRGLLINGIGGNADGRQEAVRAHQRGQIDTGTDGQQAGYCRNSEPDTFDPFVLGGSVAVFVWPLGASRRQPSLTIPLINRWLYRVPSTFNQMHHPRRRQTRAPNSVPIPAVMAIASAPQKATRIAALSNGAPPAFAPTAPKTARETRDTIPITGPTLPIGVRRAVKNGTAAPTAKDAADANAAWTGRAAVVSDMPSSSREWAASASRAISCSATCPASCWSRPRFT